MSPSESEKSVTAKLTRSGLVDPDWIDFALSHVSPLLSVQRVKARVVAISNETHDIRAVALKPNGLFRGFRPGQAIPFRVTIGGIVHERYYSLTSAPNEQLLRIAVKRQPGGIVSGYVHDQLKVGDVVELGQAVGEFVLPQACPQRLLMIAGGSGITPMISLISQALDAHLVEHVTLLYYARSTADFAFYNPLRALDAHDERFRLIAVPEMHLVSDDNPMPRFVGRFGPSHLDAAIGDESPGRVFLCGPGGLVNAVKAELAARELDDRLVCEFFALPAADVEREEASEITFARSGLTTTSRKGSILEAAEEAGLQPKHGCRIGICHTCSCTKREGVVRDLVTGAIDDRPNTPIRLCVSEPLGPVVVDV